MPPAPTVMEKEVGDGGGQRRQRGADGIDSNLGMGGAAAEHMAVDKLEVEGERHPMPVLAEVNPVTWLRFDYSRPRYIELT